MIRITTRVTRTGDLEKRLKQIQKGIVGPSKVKVGLPSGKVASDLVKIAVWNHEGTSRGIPPRPFVTMAMFDGRGAIRGVLRSEAAKVMRGEADLAAALPTLGNMGQGLVQKKITSNMPPPNAPSTIRQKGSSGTLRGKTGRLLGSITWAIDE